MRNELHYAFTKCVANTIIEAAANGDADAESLALALRKMFTIEEIQEVEE